MPEISRFLGIIIRMFYNEHNPPHFHAKYEGHIAVFNIRTRRLMAGSLPPNAVRLVREWVKLHEKELMDDWNRAQTDKELKPIQPLV